MDISHLASRRVIRTVAVLLVLVVLVLTGGQWGAARAGTVPSTGAVCSSLQLHGVAKTTWIYYAADSRAVITDPTSGGPLSITAGQTWFVCTDFVNSKWQAFFLAPGATLPVYVPAGTFQ